ncbi:MAG: hypothetical protein FWD31_06725 [Planctomycetaceae bacterium]|nr:hypothetical protein [Planctomycetaceae bacterium]
MKKTLILMLVFWLGTALHSASLPAEQWYKGELHCHSYWSDGNTLPELAIDWYRSNGFDFMSLTDHNVLQLDENKWREFDPAVVEESRKKFGDDFVETKVEGEKTLVRLKTIHELREFFNKDGSFHLIPGHEQNAGVAGRTLHANGINISESIPFPNNLPSVAEAALNWRKNTLENASKDGNVGFWMLNHPEWPYFDVTPEVFIEADEIEFCEWNVAASAGGYTPIHPDHPTHEKYWDIINAFRILQGKKPVYLVATNDTHSYPRSGTGGWVGVRSEKLEANALFTAMKKGDFYSSTGVEMKDIRFDAETKTLSVEVQPEEGVLYMIRFVGTKKDFCTKTRTFDDPQLGSKPARTGITYSSDIGITLQTVAGTSASHQMADDDLYVRAVVTSTKRPPFRAANEPPTMTALTQPYTGKHYEIANPYANVDWTTFGQYKAAYHTHSTNSDGGNTRAEMIEDHYTKGYDILNMADHNFVTTAWDEPGYGRGAGQNNPGIGALSSERRAEINAGTGRNGRGMIGIPFGNEQSVTDHIITMWADFNNTARGGMTAEQKMAETMRTAEAAGGIAILAHPGRFTGGQNANLVAGAAASNNPDQVKKYVDLFMAFSQSLVGMEIMNRLDNETRSDRILWDNILMQTMPKGKSVWGFSNDDSHGLGESGYNYNIMLLPELTADATREALETGAFYAVARVDRRLEVNNFDRNGNVMPGGGSAATAYLYAEMTAPGISSIVVHGSTITIEGTNCDYIGWVADGVEISRGNTINLNDHSGQVSSYIRAHVVGKGGVAYTQPFGIIVNVSSHKSSPL